MVLDVDSDRLNEFDNIDETELKRIPGTRTIDVLGQQANVLSVRLDSQKMNAYGVSFGQISQLLSQSNQRSGLAPLQQDNQIIQVQTGQFFTRIEEVEQLIVAMHQGAPVYLQDVANVSLGAELPTQSVWHTNERGTFAGITLAIAKQPGKNAVAVAEHLHLDVLGARDIFLEKHGGVAESATGLGLGLVQQVGQVAGAVDDAHAAASATTALAEALHERRCYTLFATHYFELTALALPRLKNLHVAAKEEEGGLVFYHQVLPGPASKSYGVEVAEMAGLPKEVVERARALLSAMAARREGALEEVLERLLALDPDRLTPLEALNQAVEILREHLTYFSNPQAAAVAAPEEAKEPEAPPEQEEELDLPLEELGLSTRVLHSLKEEGIESVRALLALNLKDLKNIPGIGERSLEEIKEALEKKGFTLKE